MRRTMLDPRLFELLTTLAAADLDWLAEEVVHGVLVGEAPVASEQAVVEARRSVFRPAQDSGISWQDSEQPKTRPLKGEQQLDWAIAHIAARIRDTLDLMSVSMARLDALVEDADRPKRGAPSATVVLISDDAMPTKVGPQQMDAARESLTELVTVLGTWRSNLPEIPA